MNNKQRKDESQQQEQQLDGNIDDDDPAYALAGSFGVDTGEANIVSATGENIVSAVINNTVSKKKQEKSIDAGLSNKNNDMPPTEMTTNKLPEHYTDDKLKRLAWEDLDVDLITKKPDVFGIPFLKFSFKQIRTIGLHFKIPQARNPRRLTPLLD